MQCLYTPRFSKNMQYSKYCYSLMLVLAKKSEQTKITHFMNLLTGNALTWVTAVWQWGKLIRSYEQLVAMFHCAFNHSQDGKEGRKHAAEYALEFCTTESRWNKSVLKTVYWKWLDCNTLCGYRFYGLSPPWKSRWMGHRSAMHGFGCCSFISRVHAPIGIHLCLRR